MGRLLSAIGGRWRSRNVAPPALSNISPQENYDNVYVHPDMHQFTGGYIPNPYRLHSPFPAERDTDIVVTDTGKTRFAYEPNIQRIPDTALQQQFNQKKLLPPVDVGVPANGVFVSNPQRTYGYMQGFVPQDTMRETVAGHAPVVLLSTPINVLTNQINKNLASMDTGRAPLDIVPAKNRRVPRGKTK